MKIKKRQLSLWEFWQLLGKLKLPWLWIVVTFGVNLCYNKLLFNLPVSTGKLMSGDLSEAAMQEALLYYGMYAGIVVLQAAILAYTDAVTIRNSRGMLWGRMLTIKESYYDSIDSSEMISAVTIDLCTAMPRVVNLLVAVIPDIIYVVKASLTISTYDISLLITMLVFLPMKYLYMLFVGRRMFAAEANIMDRIGTLTGTLGERMENLQLVKAYNKENEELERGKSDIKELYQANVAFARLGGLAGALESAILLTQQFACMVVAVVMMQKGRISMAEWITFFLFFNNISTKFSSLIQDWMDVKKVTGLLERTRNLFGAQLEDPVETGMSVDQTGDFELRLDKISFSYEGEQALKQVSITIPKGQKVAIVGSCGSGKSTTLALLERFYEPESGRITLGGVEVGTIKLDQYRQAMAYVPQTNQIFTSTIREALTYGNPLNLTDEAILKAASRTGFDAYIDLQPEGLDAVLRGGGANMSGGQLQKLIITRELLKESKIVLFDEPTSALDAESTLLVKEMLMQQFEDKTVIVVTHDLSLVDEMDQILMLHDGEQMGLGTYQELMKTCPAFQNLVMEQQGRTDHGDPGEQGKTGHGDAGEQERTGHGDGGELENFDHDDAGEQERTGHGDVGQGECCADNNTGQRGGLG